MLKIEDNRICLFDSDIVDNERTNAEYRFHEPVKQGFCADFKMPWETEGAFPNIFRDGDKWRMYYMAGARIDMDRISKIDPSDKDKIRQVVDETIIDGFKICYMESSDGIHWEKPALHICEFKGSDENNIILKKPVEFFVFKDTNPACLPQERYKAIYHIGYRLYSMYSFDGLHFEESGVICEYGGVFDSLNTAYYDEKNGRYVAFVRGMHRRDGYEYPDVADKSEFANYLFPQFDKPEILKKYLPEYSEGDDKSRYDVRRDIRVMYSTDFKTWTRPQKIEIEGENGLIQYYTNCISVYPRAPQYLIGFPNRYNDDSEWNKNFENLCGKDARKIRYGLQERYGLAVTDCVFISSKDGLHWSKSDGAFLRPGVERKDGWLYGDCYLACGLVETENQIYGHKEYSLYCVEGLWGHNCQLMRYTIRLDGFVSYHAGAAQKILTTTPFSFKGNKLFMNLSTSAIGGVKVVLIDETGAQIESARVFGDSTDKEIWFDNPEVLEKWQEKQVRMQILLQDADVYSFRFSKE